MQSRKRFHCIILASIFMMLMLSLQSQSQPVADYFFESNLNSAVLNAPALVSLAQSPQYQITTVDELQKKVLDFSAGDGLQLDISTLINNDEYTIVLLFSLDETFGYRKLIDFKHRSSDFGVYSNAGVIEFYGAVAGMNALIQPDQFIQLAMTRAIDGEINIYLNRQLQLSFMDSGELGIISANNFLYFYVDDFNTDTEHSGGQVARITLYDTVLNSSEVSELELLDVIFNDNFEGQQ